MALTRKVRIRLRPSMTKSAQNAEHNSPSMGKPFFVRAVDPNLLSDWVATDLREAGKARLAAITRNSVLLCRNNPTQGPPDVFAVAETIRFPLAHTTMYAELRNATILCPYGWLQQHLFLIIPNAHAHTGLEQHAFSESRALFGLLDRCIFPNCARCRQSALCLAGHMVFSTITTVIPDNAPSRTWGRLRTGAIVESLPIILGGITVRLSRPVITPVLDGPSVEVWAVRWTTGRSKGVSIEYVRE